MIKAVSDHFSRLPCQAHDNVSILFADIVNFTQLAAQLSAKDLVKTLNELYSKFDEDAQASGGARLANRKSPIIIEVRC